jgi:hypothetical protein
MDDAPPPRPRGDADLGFTKQQPVRWFTPGVLASTGQRVVLSAALGDFLDKRELQQTLDASVVDHGSEGQEVWIDYLADTGDGFDATYSIASLTARPQLVVDGLSERLPRAGLLILGGDEVYPAATPEEYDNRFRGPYQASLPYTKGDSPKVMAIPGNHDWYDGLTNFMRLFCSADAEWIGGRRSVQSRSYFAVKLANGWWLWGIDIQFDSYIDGPQIQYFKTVAQSMEPGAPLILCTGKPSWIDLDADPRAFRNLAYLETRVIRPAGIRLMVSISGDSHHYARFAGEDGTQKITAGGGGAFLHPTHHLEDRLDVPVDPAARRKRPYFLQRRYPDERTSRRLSLGALRLPATNPQFMVVPAVLYVLLGWTSQFANRVLESRSTVPLEMSVRKYGYVDHLTGLFRSPLAILLLLLVWGGLSAFAKPPPDWARGRRKLPAKILLGLSHATVQVAVGVFVGLVAIDVASFASGWLFTLVLLAVLGVLGGLAGTLVMGAYLAACCVLLKAHTNEAFSAMGRTDYKNFLRLRIDPEGVLTVYAIGLDKANHSWRYDPDNADPSAPWLVPDGADLSCHLLEQVVVDPHHGSTTSSLPARSRDGHPSR